MAANVDTNVKEEDIGESKIHTTQIYATDSGFTLNGTQFNTSIFGVRITLVNNSGNKVSGSKVINVWANKSMYDAAKSANVKGSLANELYSSTTAASYSINIGLTASYYNRIPLYVNYINNLTVGRVDNIMKKVYKSIYDFTESDLNEYSLKFEPIIVFRYNFYGYQYYMKGTIKEIITLFEQSANDSRLNNHDKNLSKQCVSDFIYGRTSDGNPNNNGCITGEWNVLRNYIVNPLIKESASNYLKYTGNTGHYYVTKAYMNNTQNYGLGMGLLKVSDIIQKGKIKIEKVKKSGTPITSELNNVRFNLYKGSCNSATKTLINNNVRVGEYPNELEYGQYCLEELSTPNNDVYPLNIQEKFTDFSVNSVLKTIKVKNITLCEYISSAPLSKLELVRYYINFKKGVYGTSQDYRGLLNFNSPSCTYSAETKTSTISCNSPSTSKLGDISINNNNVSGYGKYTVETNHSGDVVGARFCSYNIKFERNTSFNFPSTSNPLKSGTLLWKKNINDKKFTDLTDTEKNNILFGTLINDTKCVDIGTVSASPVSTPTVSSINFYDMHAGEDRQLIEGDPVINGTTVTTKYYMPEQYAYYGTGKHYLDLDVTDNTLRDNAIEFIGFGFWTKLKKTSNPGKMNFEIVYSDSSLNRSTKCNYFVDDEIVINNKLNLEYRTIDTKNPFPGSSGGGRSKVGANWCDGNNCTLINNKLIAEYITGGTVGADTYTKPNDSYTQSYKYKITLTPDDIKDIRAYNETHSYDDWTIDYDDVSNVKEHVRTFFQSLGVTIDVN